MGPECVVNQGWLKDVPPAKDFIRDTILPQDQSKIEEVQEKAKLKESKRRQERMSYLAVVKACYAFVKKAAMSHSVGATGASNADRRKADRVYNQLSSNADKFLRKEAPDCVSIWTDPKNGRWKMSMRGASEARRSISWTNMGEQVSSIIALRQAWDWAEQFGGRRTPAHLQALFEERGLKHS